MSVIELLLKNRIYTENDFHCVRNNMLLSFCSTREAALGQYGYLYSLTEPQPGRNCPWNCLRSFNENALFREAQSAVTTTVSCP